MRTDKAALPATDREASICELAAEQIEVHLRHPWPERTVVHRWGRDIGGVSIPNVSISWRQNDDGTSTVSITGGGHVPLHRLGALAGLEIPPGTVPRRMRGRDVVSVICVLAVHYLSRRGGGSRTLEGAHALLRERVPAAEAWDRDQHYRTIRRLTAEYGALQTEHAA